MAWIACVRLLGAGCALLLTWLSAFCCSAQHDAQATVRSELMHLSAGRHLQPAHRVDTSRSPSRPWLLLAASTTAALATTFALSEGLAYKAAQDSARGRMRSHDLGLDRDARARAEVQSSQSQGRADLMSRISNVCLAGTVAATGATLLIWLTGKRKRPYENSKTLLGPLVLRGVNGGGLVLREKF